MSVEILQQNGHDFLWIDGKLWMWNLPDEVEYQRKVAEQAYGEVLVAGYGLGIVQGFLADNPKVQRVVTSEISLDVINACVDKFGFTYGEIVIGDFYDYSESWKYDVVIGDVWIDAEAAQLAEYKRFKAKAERLRKDGGVILAWGQDYLEYLLMKEAI